MNLFLFLLKILSRKSNFNIVPLKVESSELGARFRATSSTLKYFSKEKFQSDARQKKQIIKTTNELPSPLIAEQLWLKEKIHMHQLEVVAFFDMLQRINHAVIRFTVPWCDHYKSTKLDCERPTDSFTDELMIAFSMVNYTAPVEVNKNYIEIEYPTIKYFRHFDKFWNDFRGGEKMEIVSYIHTQMSHATHAAAATPQAAGYGSNVQLSFDADFEQTVASNEPVFIMFYASWCSHCTEVKPAYSRLATKVKESNVPVRIIAVDAAENPKVADIAGIQTLPTFKIFKSGKELGAYTGNRSMEDMLQFCQTHAK